MTAIRHIKIKNFRSIRLAEFFPYEGLNCFIGPGDSGKTSMLQAIKLALTSSWSTKIHDTDFYNLNHNIPIEIDVTIGKLPEHFLSIERFGDFLRGFNPLTGEIVDEPRDQYETVLTVKFTVAGDLEPSWTFYSDRASSRRVSRQLKAQESATYFSPLFLSQKEAGDLHLSWGRNSILNKLTPENFNPNQQLINIGRSARSQFSLSQNAEVNSALRTVTKIANHLAVASEGLTAKLDEKGSSLSGSAISLHNHAGIPLRLSGTGSTNLIALGIQREVSNSGIVLLDEAEHGLEPYRIRLLLNLLDSKNPTPATQSFLTTHSPFIIRELSAVQLVVARTLPNVENGYSHYFHRILAPNSAQGALRACSEAFLSKRVIIGEGPTEIGILKGIDIHVTEQGDRSLGEMGVAVADGAGGTNFYDRSLVFKELGYETALLKDSDLNNDPAHIARTSDCQQKQIRIFEWGSHYSTEDALFANCPLTLIPEIIDLSVNLNGEDAVRGQIASHSENRVTIEMARSSPAEDMRTYLGKAANKGKWFKDISRGEELGRQIIAPNIGSLGAFGSVITAIYGWAAE